MSSHTWLSVRIQWCSTNGITTAWSTMAVPRHYVNTLYLLQIPAVAFADKAVVLHGLIQSKWHLLERYISPSGISLLTCSLQLVLTPTLPWPWSAVNSRLNCTTRPGDRFCWSDHTAFNRASPSSDGVHRFAVWSSQDSSTIRTPLQLYRQRWF